MAKNIHIHNDVAERTLDLLLGEFREKENWDKFIRIIVDLQQELEGVFSDLLTKVSLDTAEGAQLDQLGEIIGVLRGALTDDEYRELLIFQIALNRSSGEAEFIMQAVLILTDATRVHLIESFPAGMEIFTNGTVIPNLLKEKINDLAAGGVQIIYAAVGPEVPFSFDSELPTQYGKGYGWIDGGGSPVVDNAGGYAWAVS